MGLLKRRGTKEIKEKEDHLGNWDQKDLQDQWVTKVRRESWDFKDQRG